MWVINILLLWVVPLALGFLVLNRTATGAPALNERERQLLFDENKLSELTPWLAIKFAALAAIFFGIGIVEGIVLPNLPFVWRALVLLFTSGAATLLVALWLRSGSADPWGLYHQMLKPNPGKPRSAEGLTIR